MSILNPHIDCFENKDFVSIKVEDLYPGFEWTQYRDLNLDLPFDRSDEDKYIKHWMEHGYYEGRFYKKIHDNVTFLFKFIKYLKPEKILKSEPQYIEDCNKGRKEEYDLITIDPTKLLNDKFKTILNCLVYDGFWIILGEYKSPHIDSLEFKQNHEILILKLPKETITLIKKNKMKLFFELDLLSEEETQQIDKITPVSQRYIPPPAEKFNHPDCIYFLAQKLEVKKYLELGIRNSPVMKMISRIVPECHGVDVHECYIPNMIFHHQTTDHFFESNNQYDSYFDMIFIDACHDSPYVIRDFDNSYYCIRNGGLIILHDTYPHDPIYLHKDWCSDAYKVGNYIRTNYLFNDKLSYITLPFQPGLTICQIKKSDE